MPKFDQLFLDGMIYHAMPSEQKKMLEKQPVVRKKPGEEIIVHTYFLFEDQSKQVKKKVPIQLETFWACGYKMSMTLIYCDYRYYPHLKIHNLNKQSLVPLKFKIQETWSTGGYWEEKTFKLTSCGEKCSSSFYSQPSSLYVGVSPL